MSSLLHLVTAVIAPSTLDEVLDEIRRAGPWGVTVTEVRGFGPRSGRVSRYRTAELQVGHTLRLQLEVVVETYDAERLAELIALAAAPGGGRVWLSPVDQLRRIRTGERGVDAM